MIHLPLGRFATVLVGLQAALMLPAARAASDPAAVGLVAHWTFDEPSGLVAHDLTGHYPGTLSQTGAGFVPGGISGGALALDRTQNGLVSVAHIPEIATNDFTVVAWIRLPAGDLTPSTFVCSQCESWYANGFFLALNAHRGGLVPAKATFFVSAINKYLTSTTSINDGQWHQLVGTYQKGGQTRFYVDGAPAEVAVPSGPLIDRGAPFLIGGVLGDIVTGVPTPYYSGWIDDIQVYNRALADAQIDALFLNPGKDLAGLNQVILFSPPGGEFVRSVDVTLFWLISGADVRYTLDGSDPVAASPRYQSPINLQATTTVKARLFVGTAPASEVLGAVYTRSPDIVFRPNGGLFTNLVDVTLVNNLGLGTLTCTLDGSDPVVTSPAYATPIRLTGPGTIKSRIFLNNFPVSDVFSATFARVYALDDGVPNGWRERYFGPGYLTDPRVGALEDPDHDGANNLQEYTAGSDPLDPLSGFTVGIHAVPMITWASVPDQVYRVLRKVSLQDPAWEVVVPEFRATGTNSYFVDVEVAGRRAFYTIQPKTP
jgi:hypothetical protein